MTQGWRPHLNLGLGNSNEHGHVRICRGHIITWSTSSILHIAPSVDGHLFAGVSCSNTLAIDILIRDCTPRNIVCKM